MIFIEEQNFGAAVSKSKEVCTPNPVNNLQISVSVEIPIPANSFVLQYTDEAEKWQRPLRPDELHFNHGEYIYRHGDAIRYAVEEIKRKSTSNRAVVTLIDNRDVEDSGDGRLPSLLSIQLGLDANDRRNLLITAYFRALEVSSFLPVNFAELYLISKRVVRELPQIERATFTVFAFRAHLDRGNRLLRRSKLDIAYSQGVLVDLVEDGEFRKIAEFLEDKAQTETIIDTLGVSSLKNEILRKHPDLTSIAEKLSAALAELEELQHMRANDSHSKVISDRQRELRAMLMKAAYELRSAHGD